MKLTVFFVQGTGVLFFIGPEVILTVCLIPFRAWRLLWSYYIYSSWNLQHEEERFVCGNVGEGSTVVALMTYIGSSRTRGCS
jgi:hypothetical protein